MTKKELTEVLYKAVILLLVLFGVYCMVVRFSNPQLTETQLFLKVFGLC